MPSEPDPTSAPSQNGTLSTRPPADAQPATSTEPRSFGSRPEEAATSEPQRPQADFGTPIELDPAGLGDRRAPERPDDAPEPTLTGGKIPPLFADADPDAEPRLADPRPEPPPLTVSISQGMPTYAEPEPEIAGVIGGTAHGGRDTAETAGPVAGRETDGGLT
jgi:hypothetical protein